MTGGLYGGVQGFWVRTYIIITTADNPLLHKSSRRPQMVRFMLVTPRPA